MVARNSFDPIRNARRRNLRVNGETRWPALYRFTCWLNSRKRRSSENRVDRLTDRPLVRFASSCRQARLMITRKCLLFLRSASVAQQCVARSCSRHSSIEISLLQLRRDKQKWRCMKTQQGRRAHVLINAKVDHGRKGQ